MSALMHAEGPIWTLNLGDDENRLSPNLLAEVTAQLDELAEGTEPAALVTTGTGKFFSNGLDLEWLSENPTQLEAYLRQVQALYIKVITLPVPTVAAVNGHAFGAGALLALAHDFRVMRDDRGYFCLPEIDLQASFTSGMAALIQAKLTPAAALESMTTGRRYSGADAAAMGIVDGTALEDAVHGASAARVTGLAGKDRATLGQIKCTMYAGVLEALRQ